MKKSLFFISALAMLMASCGGATSNDTKGEATLSDSTEVRTVECVASGDVVYIDLDYIMAQSKLFAAEGKALEAKMQDFQTRATAAQEGWAKKEQSLASEYNKLQADAEKLQQDYAKGLITSLNAQQKQEELQKKGESIQTRMTALQTTVQTEGQALQKEEQTLGEEQMVLTGYISVVQKLSRRLGLSVVREERTGIWVRISYYAEVTDIRKNII